MSGWRYFATRVHGDGTETLLADDLPLADVDLIDDLSGPGGFTASISPEVSRLKADGRPVFQRWSTAIYAERDGVIRGGGLLVDLEAEGPDLSLEGVGFSGYPAGIPWTDDEFTGVQVDPLDVVRRIWGHLQAQPRGDLGVVVDSTTSPVRIGQDPESAEFETSDGSQVGFDAGPYKLAVWQTDDLGEELDNLAKDTPFDYLNATEWSADGESIVHRLLLGYPGIGARRHDLRFVVGENVLTSPPVVYGSDEFASEVVVLGAGEGRDMVRARASGTNESLRRVAIVDAKDVRSPAAAERLAARELAARIGEVPLMGAELTVADHTHAPIGSYRPGDEILVQTAEGWGEELRQWVRILSITTTPETAIATLKVA